MKQIYQNIIYSITFRDRARESGGERALKSHEYYFKSVSQWHGLWRHYDNTQALACMTSVSQSSQTHTHTVANPFFGIVENRPQSHIPTKPNGNRIK